MNIKYDPTEYKKFSGMNTVDEADKIDDSECVYAQNLDLGSDGAIGPRAGKSIFGNDTSGDGEILGAAVAVRRDGTQIPIRVRDTVLEWYHLATDTWYTLKTGLTDNLKYGFANYTTSTYDRIYIANGVDTTQKWNTATTDLAIAVATTDTEITVDSTTGFDSSGTIIIEGDEIAYTSKTSTTFEGVTGIGATHAIDIPVAQIPSDASAVEKGNILLVKDWRLSIAGSPTKGPTMTVSAANDPEDYTESSPRVVGDPTIEDFPEGGGKITSLHEWDKWWVIFKENTIRLFTLDISSAASGDLEVPVVKAITTAPGIGAVSHYGTIAGDNDIFYVSRYGGIRSLTDVINSERPQLNVVDITDKIRPTIRNFDFTSAASAFFDKKILVACKTTSDSSYNDSVIVYDLRTKSLSIYTGWLVSCWFVYENNLYFGSPVDPNTYQAFTGFVDYYRDDVESAIDSIWRSKRLTFGKVSKEKEIDLIYIEGLISEATSIEVTIRYDEDGSRAEINKTISGEGSYVTQTPINMLGINELGVEPLSGTISGASDLNKFRVYLTMPSSHGLYNADIQFRCLTVGGRWKITNIATNSSLREEPPAHLKL